jgi:hypothetical protein
MDERQSKKKSSRDKFSHFQHARAELGQLIQEEHAAVGQGDLARRELVRHRVDAGDIQGLVDGSTRQVAAAACRGMARASRAWQAPSGPIISTLWTTDSRV